MNHNVKATMKNLANHWRNFVLANFVFGQVKEINETAIPQACFFYNTFIQ